MTLTKMKRVNQPSDLPNEPHFAVLVYKTDSVYIEGDQRSKDCPGHGYPAHTESFTTFEHWVTTDDNVVTEFITDYQRLTEMVLLNSYKQELNKT